MCNRYAYSTENGTPFVVSGSGKPLRQFIYSKDLAKLMIWTLYEYNEISPIILSPADNEEVSIEQVANAIVKAVGFTGEYKVSNPSSFPPRRDALGNFLHCEPQRIAFPTQTCLSSIKSLTYLRGISDSERCRWAKSDDMLLGAVSWSHTWMRI